MPMIKYMQLPKGPVYACLSPGCKLPTVKGTYLKSNHVGYLIRSNRKNAQFIVLENSQIHRVKVSEI